MILSLCLWFRYFIHVNSVEASAFLLPRGWKTVFEAFSPFPRDWKTVFEAFFQLRPWPKCSFCRFSFFGHGRNAFFSFLSFRPRPKRCFCCFLLFGRSRKSIFSIFSLSAVAETLFLPFFIDCTPTKRGFSRFVDRR